MPSYLLSEDVVAICLVLAEGDLDVSMEEVIGRAEHYQEAANRHFGISRSDFRGLFGRPASWWSPLIASDDALDKVRLGDIACAMLSFHDAYCNDEGEYWTDYSANPSEASSDDQDAEVREQPSWLETPADGLCLVLTKGVKNYQEAEARDAPFYRELDDLQWQEKQRHREAMTAFFSNPPGATRDVESARALMARLNITDAVLQTFSRRGAQS